MQPINETPQDDEKTQPLPTLKKKPSPGAEERYSEASYREHVTGSLAVPTSEAPKFRPAYQPYPPAAPLAQPQIPVAAQNVYAPNRNQPGIQPQGYQPGGYAHPYGPYVQYMYYPGYGYVPYWYSPYRYPAQPARPGRDTYELVIAITSFVCSILVALGGLVAVLFFVLVMVLPDTGSLPPNVRFAGVMQFFAFSAAGLLGGGFGIYHSSRALFMRRPSTELKLPWFWVFLILYLIVITISTVLYTTGQAVTNLAGTILLIAFAGLLPAMTFMALGLRRVHFPSNAKWPTTWRRFTLALISGSTLGVVLAAVIELVLTVVAAQQFKVGDISLTDPNFKVPDDPRTIAFLLILVAVIAPVVEEAVKPVAVIALIGRIRSAAEAFVLGMACGIGFDLVETIGYIGSGYKDWLTVAIERSSAGLLHGFGAGMVALGWYLITHPGATQKANRVLLALGCWGYAILQHSLWNGSFVLQLLPAPLGPYLEKENITLGPVIFPVFLLVYVVETVLMLIFFLYVTGKLRARNERPLSPETPIRQEPLRMQPPYQAPVAARR
jgi:RsiW-degrading membrane proteinase PrsW (M82 family)